MKIKKNEITMDSTICKNHDSLKDDDTALAEEMAALNKTIAKSKLYTKVKIHFFGMLVVFPLCTTSSFQK